ncbi:MAG: hypothetical protein KJ069_14830 [Anaerolineae bacterium]|nr:hypothetical protein [Anaerolineae bacterium]
MARLSSTSPIPASPRPVPDPQSAVLLHPLPPGPDNCGAVVTPAAAIRRPRRSQQVRGDGGQDED